MNTWVAETSEDPVTGDMIVQLPVDMMFFMDWRTGDNLDYQVKDGQIVVRNLDAELREKARKTT